MEQKRNDCCALLTMVMLLMILFPSCSKLYWYRQKVKIDNTAKVPIRFQLVNQSPQYLSQNFEDNIKKFCLKALYKKGFVEAIKDTAQFDFVIQLRVDSFPVKYRSWIDPIYDGMSYGTTIREISFKYDMVFANSQVGYWVNQSNFYYFSRESRDLKRSRSIINYMLKHVGGN